MPDEKELKIERKARGVIPSKLSELINDLDFITAKDLENIIFANQTGNYTGLSGEEAEVVVDNLKRTIGVIILKTFEDHLKELLPKEADRYSDGIYLLKAEVKQGSPVFSFIKNEASLNGPYYYGNTSAEPQYLTESLIKSLSNGGEGKGDREYNYSSYKQRQVLAYPAEYGLLSEIKHLQSGINVIDLFTKVDLVVGGIDYYVYISQSTSTGEYTYKFSY
jgi:hypothetical protein